MQSPRIFVSHSHKDNEWCRCFVENLQAEGYDAWYDEKGLDGGSQWVLTIQKELQEREVFLIVLTPQAWASEWVQEELQLALMKRLRIIPVLLEHTPVEGFLLNRQWINVVGLDCLTAARRVSASLGGETFASIATSLPIAESHQAPVQPERESPDALLAAADTPPPQASPSSAETTPAETTPEAASPPVEVTAEEALAPTRTGPAEAEAISGQTSSPAEAEPVPLDQPPPEPSGPPPASTVPAETLFDAVSAPVPASTPPPSAPAVGGKSIRRRNAIGAGISVLLVVSIISGFLYISHQRSMGRTNSNASQPVRGGQIVDAIGDDSGFAGGADVLLPGLWTTVAAAVVTGALWDPLIYGDDKGNLQPGLLAQVPSSSNGGISADLKTYTLKLRPGLKWCDGTPLTSADVALAARIESDAGSIFWQSYLIASITTPDSLTAVIALRLPDASFLRNALTDADVFAPLPSSVYGAYATHAADLLSSSYYSNPSISNQPKVTNGPFLLKDRVAGDHITLMRNPKYRLAPNQPYLDRITFKIIKDPATIVTALQGGAVQASSFLSPQSIPAAQALTGYKLTTSAVAGFHVALLNLKNPILADKTVRQTMAMSLDMKGFTQSYWHNFAALTCDDMVGTIGHDPSLIKSGGCYQYDLNQADQLLNQDGWTMGADGFRHKHGLTLELRYAFRAITTRPYAENSQIAQAAWKQIGLKIDISSMPPSMFSDVVFGGKTSQWDIANLFFSPTTPDPDDHMFWQCDQAPPAGQNFGFYCNQQVDQLERQQLADPNVDTRVNDLRQVASILLQDVPLIYYYTVPLLAVASTKLHNYAPISTGPQETWNIENWYLKA